MRLSEGEELQPLGEAEFELIRRYVHKKAGIQLEPMKRTFLSIRGGKRLRQLGFDTWRRYIQEALHADPDEGQRLIEALCIHETSFFRERWQFEYLRDHFLPRLSREARLGLRPKLVRIWSAACATGEEVWSVAMTVLDRLGPEGGWGIELLATDVSAGALELAQRATYPLTAAAGIPESFQRRYLLRGKGANAQSMKVRRSVRELARFVQHNLNEAPFPFGANFDVVLCRNALIYFSPESRQRAVRGLIASVRHRGLLLVGHAESLNAYSEALTPVGPSLYLKGGKR